MGMHSHAGAWERETHPTANSLIKALIEKEILTEMTGQQRGRSYVFDSYLKLFLR